MTSEEALHMARSYIFLQPACADKFAKAVSEGKLKEAISVLWASYFANCVILDHGVFAGFLGLASADIEFGALTSTGVSRKGNRRTNKTGRAVK